MGEPFAGMIVDNIQLSVQQIKVGADETAAIGDMMIRDSSSTNIWVPANTTRITAAQQRLGGVMQSRVAIDTTGESDGDTSIEAISAPSHIVAVAGGAMHPGDRVKLNTTGITWIAATVASDITAGDVMGIYSRLTTDSAGNNSAVATDLIIIKLGVGY